MPIERAADHPTFELGETHDHELRGARPRLGRDRALPRGPAAGRRAPARIATTTSTCSLVVAGGATFHLGDETTELVPGDSAVVPIGVRHYLEAGPDGASIVVAMLAGTKLFRDDGSELVPEWVR